MHTFSKRDFLLKYVSLFRPPQNESLKKMSEDFPHAIVLVCTVACLAFALFRIFFAGEPQKGELPPKRVKHWMLLIVSVATLYIELVIIRWLGTEVRIFAFVQNVVLISCFLGFGVGCFTSEKPGSLLHSLYALTILAVVICFPSKTWQEGLLHLSNLLTLTPDAALWGHGGMPFPLPAEVLAVLSIAMVAFMLWLIAATMVPLGRWVGYCFDHSKNIISAYTVNLAGSLAGSWLLLLLAWMNLPPAAWLGLGFALVAGVTYKYKPGWLTALALFVPLAVVVHLGVKEGALWSPYQKLNVDKANDGPEYFVTVNNVGYMTMANTQPQFIKNLTPAIRNAYKESVYDTPFRFFPKNPAVLVVGAGAGNDASAALRNGASHVDAVEIDPVIYKLGKKLHPDHPYDNDKVNVVINDARNFFRTTDSKYDAVIFGLLDSHTEVSGYTNMRVDNYVYTKEAFAQAYALLKPDGVMAVKFEVREPWTWIGQRFYRTLAEVCGQPPYTYHVTGDGNMWGGSIYLCSPGKKLAAQMKGKDAQNFLASHKPPFALDAATAPMPATDDWPYPYNLTNTIPQTYLSVALILVAVAWFMLRKTITTTEQQTWPMFALGAGFMLMETQMISRLTLYFGTTWVVNSIAISTILCVLVLSNLYVMRRKKTEGVIYPAILIAALMVNFVFPWESLPYAPWVVGLLLSGAYAVAVFMAGVIFVSTLKRAKKKSAALGANVMGSVVGGLSQNLSFIFGLKALLPLAALCYLGNIWASQKKTA